MEITCNLQSRQIVSLAHEDTRLYAEVIQVAQSRQICWVRPLMLVECSHLYSSCGPQIHDLRSAADLLWPLASFQPAIDTEVIPLLVQLSLKPHPVDNSPSQQKQLRQFVQQLWQAQPQKLPPCP